MYYSAHQSFISNQDHPEWKNFFSQKEYRYLRHIMNGLLTKGDLKELLIECCAKDEKRVFHIYEPFAVLNYLGYMSPSVVSIMFKNDSRIEFWVGQNNGIPILSNQLNLRSQSSFPRNSTLEIDFWHFVDSIGDACEEDFNTENQSIII